MRSVLSWSVNAPEREGIPGGVVYDLCFNPIGSQIVAACGNFVLVYDASDGLLLHRLKGHKDTVYCVSYSNDGKRFASGGADKNVIIWKNTAEGILKFSHNDSIQSLSYNPVTQQLASVTATDFGLWSPDQKSVSKHKITAKGLCCSWTPDGQHLAIGQFDGRVTVRAKDGSEKCFIERDGPVWTLSFNPSDEESGSEVLAVGTWNGTLAFFDLNGTQIGNEKQVGFDPCSIKYFSNGEYMVIGGTDNKSALYTRDGVRLSQICDEGSWIWSVAPRPKQNFVAVGLNDGTVAMFQLVFSTVHGLYQDRYAWRDQMTDVIIQHLTTEQKVRIKCKDHVKKIAVYKHRLAVQLPDKILIYEVTGEDDNDMHYKKRDTIKKSLDCNLLVVTSDHIILCLEKKLQLFDFKGEKEREWVLEQERLRVEAQHQKEQEEKARKAAAEKAAAEEAAAKKAEEERLAAEKKAEQERIAAEKEAEVIRVAAEKAEADRKRKEQEEKQKIEDERKRKEEEAAKRKAEEQRKQEEEKKLAEQRRLQEEADAQKKAEEERLAAQKKAEEARVAAEKAEAQRKAEEERLAAEARAQEELERKVLEEELQRIAEEEKQQAQAKAEADERRKSEPGGQGAGAALDSTEGKSKDSSQRPSTAKGSDDSTQPRTARVTKQGGLSEYLLGVGIPTAKHSVIRDLGVEVAADVAFLTDDDIASLVLQPEEANALRSARDRMVGVGLVSEDDDSGGSTTEGDVGGKWAGEGSDRARNTTSLDKGTVVGSPHFSNSSGAGNSEDRRRDGVQSAEREKQSLLDERRGGGSAVSLLRTWRPLEQAMQPLVKLLRPLADAIRPLKKLLMGTLLTVLSGGAAVGSEL
uniref:Intraflagellar transport protein 122 homolog n=1 Tax=Hemiselmis andersenii TaxID=464988 RepID=A0A7S0THX9_HEMAN|mmetsp:Transcript_1214/g.2931  ORF Transcript_1214/g.2931 Transcript_1214/m.2931 type:complete len:861 (+) Transcript_1214:122-2704(+)